MPDFPVPWQNSNLATLESPLAVPELMKSIQKAIDFEGHTTAVDHLIEGSREFVGCVDLAKHTFLIFRRHGAQGTPFFARVAMGEVKEYGSGSQIKYKFTMRPWDRSFLCVGIPMIFVFTALVAFACIVEPSADASIFLIIMLVLSAASWFSPRIFQWYYKEDEPKIADFLKGVVLRNE